MVGEGEAEVDAGAVAVGVAVAVAGTVAVGFTVGWVVAVPLGELDGEAAAATDTAV